MEHKAVVVKTQTVSNGAVVFHARCCGEASTERRHTCYVAGKSEAEIEAEVQEHLTKTENLHAAVQLAAQVAAKFAMK